MEFLETILKAAKIMKLKIIILIITVFASSLHASSEMPNNEHVENDDLCYVSRLSVQDAKESLKKSMQEFRLNNDTSIAKKVLFAKHLAILQLKRQRDDEEDLTKKTKINDQVNSATKQFSKRIDEYLKYGEKEDKITIVHHMVYRNNVKDANASYWRAKFEEEHQAKLAIKEQLRQEKKIMKN